MSANTTIQTLIPLMMTRWRQGRRLFDSRLLNERRLIIAAVAGLAWFLLDSTLVTPSFKQFHVSVERYKSANAARDALQGEVERHQRERMIKEAEARKEVQALKDRIERSKQAIAEQQAMLAPASEMHNLLDGLMNQGARLQLRSIRTMPPEEVKFTPIPGVALTQALLYRQGLELSVSGSFLETLVWLRAIETMPRKLLWDGLTMKADDDGMVTLSMMVHTYSPDRDPLEMAP
jgi:MSHA biogenesis protein MshJ